MSNIQSQSFLKELNAQYKATHPALKEFLKH